MDEALDISQQIESIRKRTITLLEQIADESQVAQLPEPPTALQKYSYKLLTDDYLVLVAGEAKRGKSSFINALIGRTILPTNVKSATCQVFRISDAANEAYRIRFEDESTRDITIKGLDDYGSQRNADTVGIPNRKDLIRWIEVDIPAHFLPKGVSLLDSPGLGSIYLPHAQITQRFVPRVDGVIFVLDSVQPIILEERVFLETILSKTPHIFFIQTKIDQQDTKTWQALLKRNQEILQEHFKDRLADTHVWPVSNTNLLEAFRPGKEDDQGLLWVSGYREMAEELQKFLFRVAGWGRVIRALQLAENYYQLGYRTLVGRLTHLGEEYAQKRIELQQQFDSEWGKGGKKQREFLETLHSILAKEQLKFRRFVEPSGKIEKEARDKIDGLKSLEKAREHNSVINGEVVDAFLHEWERIYQEAESQCSALLVKFLAAANSLNFLEDTSLANVTVKYKDLKLEDDLPSYFKQASQERNNFLIAFSSVLPGHASNIAVLATILWTGIRILFIRKDALLGEAKQQLHEHLDEVLEKERKIFLDVNLADGLNYVDKQYSKLANDILEQVRKITSRKSKESKTEVDKLRKTKTAQVQEQLARWKDLSNTMREIVRELKTLEQSLAISSVPVI